METFGVLLIAVDEYPDPPGSLPSSNSANRLSKIVVGDRGGRLIESVVAKSQEDVIAAFERWVAPGAPGALSSLVYLVGHGTDDGLDHSFLVPGPAGIRELRTSEFAKFFQSDWFRRQADRVSWTLFVLDCCAADVGITNLQNALTAKALKRPRRLALWPVTPSGASHSGRFVDAFERAIARLTDNDTVISLNEVFERLRPELGDLEPDGALPPDAVLQNPIRAATPVVMNLDAYAELRRVIRELPADVRNHFLTKAQGGEAGDLAWYFSGRDREIHTLSTWLRESRTGMRVVTGEAGSGKSALLGHLIVLSDDKLAHVYAANGLATDIRPPSNVFDASLHLTGRTLAQTLDDLRRQMGARGLTLPDTNTPDDWLYALRAFPGPPTLLADALDEAQEPTPIAEFFRQAVASGAARVVIGTRRSLGEGPDQPADPGRRELIDALAAGDEELVVVGRDRDAMREYVVRRLSAAASPYAGNRDAVEALADRIASTEQPMLFARLITSELLTRPLLAADDEVFERLLKGGHREVFAAAVERLTTDDPAIVVMLRALALGRGRGVPETGGTWLAMARGLADGGVPDTAVRRTIEQAAPYVMLDAEAGQSVYRLAHRTFVEYFRAQPGAGVEHRTVASALHALVEHKGGWDVANFYLVRYLPEHFTADLDRTAPDRDGLAALATDAAWLSRAMTLLGVDGVVDTLASARRSLGIPLVETVERVLRRARIALSRDPAQLAGQVHARLHNAKEPQLASLGEKLAQQTYAPWLRLQYGTLEWQADLETTYGLIGKVRALAFGQVDGQPLVAIGIDDVIRLWDPRRGQGSDRVVNNDRRRPTALALAHLDGRPVVVAASSYDHIAVIRDLHSGARIGPPLELKAYVNSIALGHLGDRAAIAAAGNGSLFTWDVRTGAEVTDLPASLGGMTVRSVSVVNDRLVAFVVREMGALCGVWVVDIATGNDVWPEPKRFGSEAPDIIAGTESCGRFVAAGGYIALSGITGGPLETWLPERPADSESRPAHGSVGPVRTLAPGEVLGRAVVAYAPDYDTTALVSIRMASAVSDNHVADSRGAIWPSNLTDWSRIQGVYARSAIEPGVSGLALLSDGPLAVIPLADDEGIDARPDTATVTFALTGMFSSGLAFIGLHGSGFARLPPFKTRPSDDAPYRADQPDVWPRWTHRYGVVNNRAVVAVGSIGGAVWIWDLVTQAIVAGPFAEMPERRGVRGWSNRDLRMKGGPSHTSSVALGQHPRKGDIVAVAHEGSVRVMTVPDGEVLATSATEATVVIAVALGQLFGEEVLVTGSQGGVIVVWGLAFDKRIATLTIDSAAEKVWVVRGADAIAVQTTDKGERTLLVFDAVRNAQ